MKRILIITNDSYDYIKIFINQTVKYAKGFIQLGHGFRSFSYNGLLKEISSFKNKRIKKKFYKNKADLELQNTNSPDFGTFFIT